MYTAHLGELGKRSCYRVDAGVSQTRSGCVGVVMAVSW